MRKLLTAGIIATVFTLVIGGGFRPRPISIPDYTPYGGACLHPGCDRG